MKKQGSKTGLTGTCKYCGELRLTNCEHNDTEEERDEYATMYCDCYESVNATKKEEYAENARKQIDELFGDGTEKIGASSIKSQLAIELMRDAVVAISDYQIVSVSMQVTSRIKAKIAMNSKGKIDITRTDTDQYKS